MGLISWVIQRVGGGINTVASIPGKVIDAVKALWGVLTGLGHLVHRAWSELYGGARWFLTHTLDAVHWIYAQLWHLLFVVIPRAVGHAITVASRYAAGLVHRLEAWARAAYHAALAYAARIVATLEAWARAAVSEIRQRLSDAWNLLTRTANRVWSLLDDADHLALWLAAAMVRALWRYVQDEAVTVARWVLRNGAGAALEGAGMIEDILTRVL